MRFLIQRIKNLKIDNKTYPDINQMNYPDNNQISRYVLSKLTYKVLKILFKIHNTLGPNFKEDDYKKAIDNAFVNFNIHFLKEKNIKGDFGIFKLNTLRVDFIIENVLVLEIKAKPFITKEDIRQVLRYLKISKLPLALIVNFRRKKLEIKRIINPEVIDNFKNLSDSSDLQQSRASGNHLGNQNNNKSGKHQGNTSGSNLGNQNNNSSGFHQGSVSGSNLGNNILLIYVGIEKGDEKKNLEEVVEHLENLQIIENNERFSQTIKKIKPVLIFVSNITLIANFEKGRINFNQNLNKELVKEIYEKLIAIFKNKGYSVFSTPFGSYLQITSTNLGPINFYLQI